MSFPLRRIVCQSVVRLLAVFVLAAGIARAEEPIALAPGIDFSVLPPPPADDSPAGLADLSVLLYVQANRTPEQEAFAKKMASPSVFEMGREIFGPWFTRKNMPKTAEILSQMTKATDKVKEEAKKHWKRPRPYVRSERISPVVGKPGDAGCYPSGHTYGIAVPAFLLSEAFPDQAEKFDEMIHRVMWGRIVGGVHYPTDTEAGRLLAKDVVAKMLESSPKVQQAVETIRQEAAAARKAAEDAGESTEDAGAKEDAGR